MSDNNVGEFYGKQKDIRTFKEDSAWVLPSTMIGLEIELEGFIEYPKFNGPAYWEQKEDGSLRTINNKFPIEFVFSSPLCGYDLSRALVIFNDTIRALKTKPYASPRASTHVHLDVREISFSQLLNLIIIYTVVERVLYKYCGVQREENNFCLPFYKAEGHVFDNLSADDILGGAGNFAAVSTGSNRYNGLNICALKKFGTLEFRQFPGTFNIEHIKKWINIIMCLKKAAIEYKGNLNKLPTTFSEMGMKKQVEEIFGEFFNTLEYPDMEYDVLRGIRLAQDILFRNNKHIAESKLDRLISDTSKEESIYYKTLKKELGLGKKEKGLKKQATYSTTNLNIELPIFGARALNEAVVRVRAADDREEIPTSIPELHDPQNYEYRYLFRLREGADPGERLHAAIEGRVNYYSERIRVNGEICNVIVMDNGVKYLINSINDVFAINPRPNPR